MPSVSIITPSYQQAQFLEETLQSVLNQNYSRLEYIVIDGASNDGSVDIIQRYADRLAYWVSEKDSGQAEAINKGFARASGEIVAWLNSDDYYLPGAVAAAAQAFEQNPRVALVYGNMLAVDERSATLNTLTYQQLTLTDLLCFQIIGQPAVFMRRAALRRAGGLKPSLHFLLDHDLWIRMAQQGEILHVPQVWAAARYHPAAKNRAQASRFGEEAFRLLAEAAQDETLGAVLQPLARRARASAHRVDARYLLDAGQYAKSLSAWARAFFLHPPTAWARTNLLASAMLGILGLEKIRAAILSRRKASFEK